MSESNKNNTINKLAAEMLRAEDEVDIRVEDVTNSASNMRMSQRMAELQKSQTDFLEKVRKENKVSVSVAPQYAAEFSNNMRVTINGISIFIPINGREYMVPETFADEIKRRVRKVNQKLNRFTKNGSEKIMMIEENTAGEVKFY